MAAPELEYVVKQSKALFFASDFCQVYGMTEISDGLSMLPPQAHDPQVARALLLRSAGNGIAMRIVDPAICSASGRLQNRRVLDLLRHLDERLIS